MREILAREPNTHFFGAGGARMAALASGPFENWIGRAGVVGLWDVLRNYGYFRTKFQEFKTLILRERPDAVLFVDYPGFNLRMARALRPHLPATRMIYYISPQVWAWNRRRIPRMARDLDRMLCLFPFEPPLYENSGLHAEFVGHPLVEELGREDLPKEREESLLGLFPGSREREIRKLFPVMLAAVGHVRASRPDVEFVAAAAGEKQAAWMHEMAVQAGETGVRIETGTPHNLMARAAFAWVCSGTATLEAAILGLPFCLVYKVPWLTYEVGRRVIRVPFLGMVNILAGCEVVREFIQAECTPFALADAALAMLNNPKARAALSTRLLESTRILGEGGAAACAAQAVLRTLDNVR
jgi:lipid-A-disaccharide synthase